MKLVYTDGCVCTGLTVDGKNYDDCNIPLEKKREIVKVLIDKLDEGDLDNELMDLIQLTGVFEHIGDCEQCGDSIYEWTIEV